MSLHIFRPDYELLDLNAMEMDDALVHFFENIPSCTDSESVIEFTNGEGLTRKLKVNIGEKMIQGRGIKGFFAPYRESSHLFIEASGENKVTIQSPDSPAENWHNEINELPDTKERMHEVLQASSQLQLQDKVWFDLYEAAQQFSVHRIDDLICLPHIRELETFEYQVKTVKSVIARFKGRAMLCDEVGLGKTVEAGLCMMEYIMRGLARKILILVPPSLINQWRDEMRRKFNQDFICSDDRDFTRLGGEAWGHYNKVIASINTAKRSNHSKIISQIDYDLVIVDEAHHVKNRRTVAWDFVNRLKKKYMLLLTATPVQNSLEELYNLITLLKPGQLKTYQQFRKNFVQDNQGIEVKNADKLKTLLSEVMIRNRRNNVDVQFTKRKAYTNTVQLSERERRLYDELSEFIRSNYMDQHPVFSRFLLKNIQEQMGSSFSSLAGTLQKLAHHESLETEKRVIMQRFYEQTLEIAELESEQSRKIEQLSDILTNFGDKMLVFTKYKTTQELISRSLRDRDFKVAEFHGSLRRMDKEREITFFREGAEVLVSTEVGGEGRNLQFCNGIVNFDLPWNPMAIEQRIGRIHRIGQTRDVFVYNLAAENTLEHYMLHVLDRKINMFELVVGEVDMILGDIDESEEFSDIVMNAWVRSDDTASMEREMEEVANKMLENKDKLQKVKAFDEQLFA